MTITRAGACALIFACTAGAAGAAVELPARRAGLWEMHMVNTSTPGMNITARTCVGPGGEPRGAALAQQRSACGAAPTVTPAPGGGWAYHLTCPMRQGMTVESSGVATGDFRTGYVVHAVTKMTPAPIPSMARSEMTITSRWLGACPAGMRPGQSQLVGGPMAGLRTR